MQASRPLPYDYDVVTRHVDGTLSETRRLVEASAARSAQLRIDAPFTAVAALRSWHTTGRLYAPGIRIARYTRVNLEITAWSAHTTEVRLRAVTRRIPNWGKQRQPRYFALAHRTVDELYTSRDRGLTFCRRRRRSRGGRMRRSAGESKRRDVLSLWHDTLEPG